MQVQSLSEMYCVVFRDLVRQDGKRQSMNFLKLIGWARSGVISLARRMAAKSAMDAFGERKQVPRLL